MTIPKDCLISLETAFETSYGKKIGEFMYNELNSPKHCLLTSFLLYEEGPESSKEEIILVIFILIYSLIS